MANGMRWASGKACAHMARCCANAVVYQAIGNVFSSEYTVRAKPVWLEPTFLTQETWPFAAQGWLAKMVLAQPNWILRAFLCMPKQPNFGSSTFNLFAKHSVPW
jgi:hypothetical protein